MLIGDSSVLFKTNEHQLAKLLPFGFFL